MAGHAGKGAQTRQKQLPGLTFAEITQRSPADLVTQVIKTLLGGGEGFQLMTTAVDTSHQMHQGPLGFKIPLCPQV